MVRCSAQEAWRQHSDALALDRHELDDYLQGGLGSFMTLEDIRVLACPLSLEDLRRNHSFRPPRSYRFVSSLDPKAIRDLARSG
jgi:predicted transcriptional regulator